MWINKKHHKKPRDSSKPLLILMNGLKIKKIKLLL